MLTPVPIVTHLVLLPQLVELDCLEEELSFRQVLHAEVNQVQQLLRVIVPLSFRLEGNLRLAQHRCMQINVLAVAERNLRIQMHVLLLLFLVLFAVVTKVHNDVGGGEHLSLQRSQILNVVLVQFFEHVRAVDHNIVHLGLQDSEVAVRVVEHVEGLLDLAPVCPLACLVEDYALLYNLESRQYVSRARLKALIEGA